MSGNRHVYSAINRHVQRSSISARESLDWSRQRSPYNGRHGFPMVTGGPMSAGLRQLQHRAEDLADCLLIFELELKKARNLEKRMAAFYDFGKVVDRIDLLRRDAEEFLLSPRAKAAMLANLDR